MLTGALVLSLSVVFALIQNPRSEPPSIGGPPAREPLATVDPARLSEGRAVYDELGCARCHAIAGRGSPRAPLDGVGARLDREALRQWTVAAGPARDRLSPRAVAAKEAFADLPAERMDPLLDYLSSLRETE